MKIIHEYSDGNNQIRLQMEHGVVLIHLDAIGKCFGKKSQDFLNLSSTQKLITHLQKEDSTGHPILETRTKCKNPGIWAQRLLALEYAYWLNPAFVICIMKCFGSFINTTVDHVNREHWPFDTISDLELENFILEWDEIRKDIKRDVPFLFEALNNAANKNQLKGTSDHPGVFYTNDDIATITGLKVSMLKEILLQKDVIYNCGGTWLLTKKYQNKEYTKTEMGVYYDAKDDFQMFINTSWTWEGTCFVCRLLFKDKEGKIVSFQKNEL